MIRTQIYLPQDLHRQLTALAREQKSSLAGVIRDFVKHGLERQRGVDYSGKKAMQAIAKLNFKGGPHDLSANLDYYLYDEPYQQKNDEKN